MRGRFTLREAHLETRPIQRPPLIYLAAIGPRALRLAGAVADGVLLNAYAPTAYMRYAIGEVRVGATEAGRDPSAIDIARMLPIRRADDPAPLMPALKQRIFRLLGEPHVGELLLENGGFDASLLSAVRQSDKADGGKSAAHVITQAMVESFYVVGSAARCRERVREYRDSGVGLPLLLPLLEDYRKVAEALGDRGRSRLCHGMATVRHTCLPAVAVSCLVAQTRWGGRPRTIRSVCMWKKALIPLSVFGTALLAIACSRVIPTAPPTNTPFPSLAPPSRGTPSAPRPVGTSTPTGSPRQADGSPASYIPDITFKLQTGIGHEGLVFEGTSGALAGLPNPTLRVATGAVAQVALVNGDGATHDIAIPDFSVASERVTAKGASTSIVFRASKAGQFAYFCTVPGHRQAGMEGKIIVGDTTADGGTKGVSVARDPSDLPGPLPRRGPQSVRVDLETVELEGQLAEGATYTYWTFNAQVPGPFLRDRKGDVVELHLKNRADSKNIHSIDLHAVTGPGGGASVMQVAPGEEKSFTFKALSPGLYVYHCATPMVAHHIASGMFGMILVEPESGLPPVDREFYVMQGEVYTSAPYGQRGHQEFSVEKLLAESPEYAVFNGAVGALTAEHPLKAKVGETVRIYFGVGGPDLTSSFHVIGEIFDRVYSQGSLTAAPLTDVQTTLVPPGGATVVECKLEAPGRYILVDHALSRMERGLVGFLLVDGPANPEVFREGA